MKCYVKILRILWTEHRTNESRGEELKLKYCMLVILKEGIVWKKSSCRDGKGKIGEDQEGKGKGVHATFLTSH